MVGYDEDEELGDSLEHAENTVACLVSYGAVRALAVAAPGASGEARVRLTPLGRMLAESVFAGCAPSADADAATLTDVLGTVPPKIAAQMAATWLAARSPVAAVRELLAYAEHADPAQRMTAIAFATGVGHEGAPAWREWADRPGFGAYARMWLAEQGEDVAEHPGDQAWLTVEALSAAGAAIPPELTPLVFAAALGNADADETAEALSLLSGSGHPAAAQFIESVTAVTGMRSPAVRPARPAVLPGGDVYQLKITLRGVSKPPIWRRIAVPAALTLDLLHEVIQQAMGWEDGHMHVFSTPRRDYGTPDSDLGHADEGKVTLAEVLAEPGARWLRSGGELTWHAIAVARVLAVWAACQRPVTQLRPRGPGRARGVPGPVPRTSGAGRAQGSSATSASPASRRSARTRSHGPRRHRRRGRAGPRHRAPGPRGAAAPPPMDGRSCTPTADTVTRAGQPRR